MPTRRRFYFRVHESIGASHFLASTMAQVIICKALQPLKNQQADAKEALQPELPSAVQIMEGITGVVVDGEWELG